MSLRTKSREFALQMLFQWENSGQPPEDVETGFWKSAGAEGATRQFANQLFEGAVRERETIDPLLIAHATHWRIDRMASIDRNILRLAVYELRVTDTPPAVVIDEAVELAKKFSTAEAPPFINGILDAIRKAGKTSAAAEG
jgi:N utilization substance protein B